MTPAEIAQGMVEEMMAIDPDTREVVAAMRGMGRNWVKIHGCFFRHMASLGIANRLPDRGLLPGNGHADGRA